MAVHLHRAPRTDLLADELGRLLLTPLEDAFAAEVVVVPAKGVERWLSQRLSHRLGATPGRGDGVCAGVDFRSPGSLFAGLREASGAPEDPWAPQALTWPLLGAIDDCLDAPWAATLARHLGHGLDGEEGDLRRGRRFALARRLARLFASYAAQRPAVVADWAAGGAGDGLGGQVPPDLAWQPPLWRAVAARIDAPAPHQLHASTLASLETSPDAFDLPARVSLFGHTRLASTEVELVAALARHRDVHLWLPHPSAALWDALSGLGGPVPRAADRSHEHVGHPLLATLGRDTRELQRSLSVLPGVGSGAAPDSGGAPEASDFQRSEGAAPAADSAAKSASEGTPPEGGVAPDPTPANLLGWLQADLRANEVGPRRQLDPADRSVQVHACHGPARQVEVLREVLLGLLQDDPTLEPRDVLVMCPDIEAYAPLLAASFGLADVVPEEDGHPGHRLRVRLADRALDQTNPLLAVAARLLDLAGGRAGVGEVLDLAHVAPVRRRFGLRDDDLEQLTVWAAAAGVRWGFDAPHRSDFGLAEYVANTWEFGVDRILAGVALSEDAETWLDKTLPLDDVGSGQVELAGRLAELVTRLRSVTDRLVGVHEASHWMRALEEGVGLLTSVTPTEAWQVGQMQRVLRGAVEGDDVAMRLPDVRALLADALAGRPTRANFRTGTLTVATLVPMRSVPHRVVAILGMDDGVFPRTRVNDGDDLLAREPVTGERDARTEDRQLFLDAVLAATETLVITYTGANEFSGQPRPPAIPLGELLDALDETAVLGEVGAGRVVTVHHPLQPFDQRNLTPGALVPGRAFSFDRSALAGAVAAAGQRRPPAPLLTGPLPPLPAGDVQLDDLLAFYRSPVKGFFRERLDLALAYDEEPLDDGLPVELDSLQQWSVGDRVLRDLLAGHPPDRVKQQEWRRGVLPPGWLGWRTLGEVMGKAEPLAAEVLRLRTRPASSVDVDVDLGAGRRLRGTVPEVYGDRLVPAVYSRLGATHRLQSWIRLLALASSQDDRAWSALTLGRPANSRSKAGWSMSQLGPLDHTAVDVLRDLVAMRDRGLTEPLPLPLKSSLAYARQRRTQATVDEALVKAGWDWRDGRFPGEQSDPEQVRAWGRGAPLPGVDEPPRPGEETAGETTRFGALAVALWGPLLAAEQGSW